MRFLPTKTWSSIARQLFIRQRAAVTLLGKLVGHFLVVLESGDGLASPRFQLSVVAALGVALEQVHCVLVSGLLIRYVLLVKIASLEARQLVELRLVRAIHRGGQFGLDLAAGDQPLQF